MLNKNLIIFGPAGTLGKGVTKALLRKNYLNVYLFDRHDFEYEQQERVKFTKVGDLSIEKNVEQALHSIRVKKNELYFLFCAIGGFSSSSIAKTKLDDWLLMQKINVTIPFLISKHFYNLAAKSRGSSICFTSAITSLRPEEGKSAYGGSKIALNYLIKTLSIEGRKINLSANVIAPYALDTDANREWVDDKNLLIKPEKVGEIVHDIFTNFESINGNIIELFGTFYNN